MIHGGGAFPRHRLTVEYGAAGMEAQGGKVGFGPHRTTPRRDEARGLASALRGEVQVIGSIVDVDAYLDNLDGAVAATEALTLIEGARTVFNGRPKVWDACRIPSPINSFVFTTASR